MDSLSFGRVLINLLSVAGCLVSSYYASFCEDFSENWGFGASSHLSSSYLNFKCFSDYMIGLVKGS
jgi:hypothetical protein